MADREKPQMTQTLRDNIARLTARQRADRQAAPFNERLAEWITRFTGSMSFVLVHIVIYTAWIVANVGSIPGLPRFDPSLVILAMEASVEAIFLSTFVLISQNRMAAAADRRGELDLHITLLTEHELTRLAALVERIAQRIGVDADLGEVKHDVEPEEVLDALDAHKRAAGLDR